MKKPFLSKLLRYAAALTLITAIIYGCKKEFSPGQVSSSVLPVEVSTAKSWYQATYPLIAHSNKKAQSTPSGMPDYSQFLQPDWDNAVIYSRFGQDVTEVPVGANSPFAASLKNQTLNQTVYRKQDSKSSFLILKDSTGYHAFVMVLMADSTWLNGDQSKLTAQHYNKRSPDFTGLVLYFTPKGRPAGMWQYSGGKIVANNSIKSNKQIQNNGKKINESSPIECEDYYLIFLVNGREDDDAMKPILLFSICYGGFDGSSGGGGGTGSGSGDGSPSYPPNLCDPQPDVQSIKNSNTVKILKYQPDPQPGDGGDGYPPPSNGDDDPCGNQVPSISDIKDNVSNPCLQSIVETISNRNNYSAQHGGLNSVITNMLQTTFGVSDNVNVTFQDGVLTGSDASSDAIRSGGVVRISGQPDVYNLSITFNSSQLNNASKEFLAETVMHETLHAYLTVNSSLLGNMKQHNYMIQNFVGLEVNALQQNFPTLNSHDVLCIVLGGYGQLMESDKDAYNNALSIYKETADDVATTNNGFKSGQSGTKCN